MPDFKISKWAFGIAAAVPRQDVPAAFASRGEWRMLRDNEIPPCLIP
jgi:hypothetical protein